MSDDFENSQFFFECLETSDDDELKPLVVEDIELFFPEKDSRQSVIE